MSLARAGIPSGWADKLYWRIFGTYHCFKKTYEDGKKIYVSLCGRVAISSRIGGQAIERPSVAKRCGRCDGLEMERRGWTESGPATV